MASQRAVPSQTHLIHPIQHIHINTHTLMYHPSTAKTESNRTTKDHRRPVFKPLSQRRHVFNRAWWWIVFCRTQAGKITFLSPTCWNRMPTLFLDRLCSTVHFGLRSHQLNKELDLYLRYSVCVGDVRVHVQTCVSHISNNTVQSSRMQSRIALRVGVILKKGELYCLELYCELLWFLINTERVNLSPLG